MKIGHNSKRTKAGPVNADRLKSFVERIERLEEERKAIGSDIKDIYSEAKGVGYDVKTMRKLITVRAMDAADRAEQETLLDTYAHAIGMETSSYPRELTEDELLERAGRIVDEADRCMALSVDGRPPKIGAIQELIGCSQGKASKLRVMVADRISRSEPIDRENENPGRPMTADDLGDPLLVIDRDRAKFRERIRTTAASIKPPKVEAPAPVVTDDQALAAMDDSFQRLQEMKRARGLA